ncbi:MAG: RNA-directed DNA polymerase [Clostridiales bacterium]|nr:RNA-directed DNA polymerase [Clostridiales bacterium]
MNNTGNTRRDGASYDCDSYQPGRSPLTDANVLYDAWLAAQKNSAWKPKVQIFEMHWLSEIADLQAEIATRTYEPRKPSEFVVRERGKERLVHGGQVRDRVAEHALNDEIIMPAIAPYLIYNNGASQKNKGTDFTRRELVKDLVEFYNQHGNDGYILLMDFSKYYDNIRHDILLDQLRKYVHDDTAIWMAEKLIRQFEVDVSYMSDEEYAVCMDMLFNSLEYQQIDKSLLTGEKFMPKHLDIGNQTSQSAGILYPTPVDNYIKIVRGEKHYARYMDDSYTIHHNREHLVELQRDVTQEAAKIGITVNQRKTHIAKLSDHWRFMQIQYCLMDNGRIQQKINPERVTAERQKMKKVAPKMPSKQFHDEVFAWIKSNRKYMSRKQYQNIVTLHNQLQEVTL